MLGLFGGVLGWPLLPVSAPDWESLRGILAQLGRYPNREEFEAAK